MKRNSLFELTTHFLWPQMYCEEYIYVVCIHRKEQYPSLDPLALAWYQPTIDDFEMLMHAAGQVGMLKMEKLAGLVLLSWIASDWYKEWKATSGGKTDIASRMLKSLEHDIMLLLNHPLTFRDLIVYVAQVQHHFLDIFAFLDFVIYVQACFTWLSSPPTPVHANWMVCFTTDTKVYDNIFHTGVPVWLICSPHTTMAWTNIEKSITFPNHIIHSMYSEAGKPPYPFPPFYCSPGSFAHHFTVLFLIRALLNPPPYKCPPMQVDYPLKLNPGEQHTKIVLIRSQASKTSSLLL